MKGYKLLSKGKQEGEKVISGVTSFYLKLIFKIFEVFGQMESAILKSFPGAGFFIQADVEKKERTT